MLTMEVVFLLAITSVQQLSKLAALSADPPYKLFTEYGVVLRVHPPFLPKVNSVFHI